MEGKETLYQTFNRELRHILRTHHAVCDGRVKSLGLHPAQHMLLMHLACRREIASQRELAQHMHISPAALTVSLGKLETAGYIKKEASAADGRVNAISITEKGRALLDESRGVFDAIDEGMFTDISDEDVAAVTRILRKMHDNLNNMKESEDE
jgi:DNA-binding MarR family transcriptional regulator